MKYKHIFFDLDRTIWDFDANFKDTFSEIYQKYDLQKICTFSEFIDKYQYINAQLWRQYRNNLITKDKLSWKRFYFTMEIFGKQDKATAKKISQDYIDISPTKTKLFLDAHKILNYLNKKYKLYIITNGFKKVQYKKIKNSDLEKYFTHIFVSEEVGFNKPNPNFFNFVLLKTGATIYDSVVIGDDIEADIMGANKFNISTIWFNYNKQDYDFKPDYEINRLIELKNIL